MRLRSRTERMSSNDMFRGSLPAGLPPFAPIVPCAPMSPPAQLTRMSMRSNRSTISATMPGPQKALRPQLHR